MLERTNRPTIIVLAVALGLTLAMAASGYAQVASDEQQTRDEEAEALARMLQARAAEGEQPAEEPPVSPQQAAEAGAALKLTGNEVIVETIGDTIILSGNEADLRALEAFILLLDEALPAKQFEMITLENRDAKDVAAKLQDILAKLRPRERERPEERIDLVAVSSNILLIAAPPDRMEQVKMIAARIDEVPKIIPKVETMKFFIQYRKAGEVAEELKAIITKLQAQQGAAGQEIDIIPNDADNSIMIVAPQSEREKIERLIKEIDIKPVEGYGHVKLVLFPLIETTAEDLSEVLTDMLQSEAGKADLQEQIRRLTVIKTDTEGRRTELKPLDLDKPLRIFPDKSTNSLIVATVEENIEPMGEIIRLLDGYPIGHEMSMKIFPLRFADAKTVLDMLKDMFEKGKDLPERAPGGKETEAVPPGTVGKAFVYNIALAADARTNTLIVSGRPEQIELVERVVHELDSPVTSVKFPLRLLFLGDHVDATRVAGVIEELFTKRIELLEKAEAGKTAMAREEVFLAVDIRSNALIISASEENYQEIANIAEQLNVASDKLIDNIRIINCQNTSAADLAEKIDELWQRKAKLRREGDVPEDLPVMVADQRSNSLVIASSPEDFEEIKRLVDRLEAQPLSPIAEIRLLTLKNNDASEVGDMLTKLFEERMKQRLAKGQEEIPSDRVAVAVDATTNTLLIASSQENFEEMTRIVTLIDIEPPMEGVVRTFVLKNAEAKDTAERIKDLFDQGLYSPSAGLESKLAEERMKIAVVADSRSNSLIVSASKPNLSIIEKLIEQMDSELAPLLQDDTRLVVLAHADAVKVTDMLERLFDSMKSKAAEPDLFRVPTIIPDERSNTLIIAGARDALKRCDELIGQLDRQPGPPTSIFQVYPLVHSSAVKLATKMQELFDKRSEGRDAEASPIFIQADEASNSLIASASRDDQELIADLLPLLDKPSNISRQFQIFPLEMGKAEAIADTLEQLFKQQAEGTQGRADAIAVQPDPRTNSLVVWAAPSEMDNIGAIIAMLDRARPAVDMMIKVIRLRQALAEDLAESLKETLKGGESGDEEAAVLVSFTEKLPDGTEAIRKLLRQDVTITPDPRTNSLMVMAPAGSMDMLESLIKDIDRIRPITAEIRIFPLANADAEEVVNRLDEIFGTKDRGDGEIERMLVFGGAEGAAGEQALEGASMRTPIRFTADRRTNTVIAAGNSVDLRMAEELIRQLDAQDVEDRIQEVYRVRNLTAEAVASSLKEFADAENDLLQQVEDETAVRRQMERKVTVIGDKDSNTVMIGASPRYYSRYMELMQQIDRPPPQVLISVLIAEVSMDDRFELGVEFAAQDLHFSEGAVVGPNGVVQGDSQEFDMVLGTDIGAAGTGFGGLSLTVTGEDFGFLMRALQSDGQLEVLSRPTLLVQDNATGNITIGDRVPIVSGTTSAGGQSSTQVNYEEVGIILEVTPHINPDGYVNLEIKPEISQISNQSLQLSEGLIGTVFSERSAETTVTIKDGETVILGGLITETRDESTVKVPWLGDLPLIGRLFRTDAKIGSKTELLIVLTVRVLYNEDDLRMASERERDRTGFMPERIKRHPLMEGLRIRAEDDLLGPVEDGQKGRSPAPAPPRDRSIYGPRPETYGPHRPTTTQISSTQEAAGVYGPELVRSDE